MSTTISKLEVELTLDSKKFEARVRGSKEALKAFTGAIGKADGKVKRHTKNVRNLGTSFRHTIVTLGLMRDALRTAWRASGGLVQGIVDVTAEFERLNILLKGMSQGATEMERAADAAEQFRDVIELAKSAPFAVKELTNSWVKFRSVGIDPSTGSLNALVDAVSAFGGTGDILHRATIAVQQMAGKGVISMEELRQQMGEAVPQAMVLLARGMNMSVGDMVRAIAKGSVIAKPALQKLFAEFDLTFGGASIDLMNTYIGSLARLDTVWQLTLKEMGEASGLFEAVKDEVKRLTKELDDPAIRRFGIDIASGMVSAFKILVHLIRESVAWFTKHSVVIRQVIAVWGTFKGIQIAKYLLATNVATKALTKSLVLLGTAAFAPLIGKSFAAGRAIVTMKKGLIALRIAFFKVPIIGWAAALVTLIATIGAWLWSNDKMTESNERGMEAVKKYKEAAEELDIVLAKQQIVAQEKALQSKQDYYDTLLQSVTDSGQLEVEAFQIVLGETEAALIKSRAKIAADKKVIDDAINGAARRAADQQSREMVAKFRLGMESARNLVRKLDAELNEAFAAEGSTMTEEERLAQRLVIYKDYLSSQTVFVQEQLAEQNKKRIDAEKVIAAATKGENVSLWIAQRDNAIATILQISATAAEERIKIAKNISAIYKDTSLLDEAGLLQAGYASSLETILTNGKAKLAGMKAEIFDGMKELEAFMSKVESGKFGFNFTPEMKENLAAAIAMFKEIDIVSDELKAKNAFESTMLQAAKSLGQATEEALIFSDAVKNNLFEVPDRSLQKIRKHYAGVVAMAKEQGLGEAQINAILAVRNGLLKIQASTSADKKILDIRSQIKDLDIAAIVNLEDRFAKELELYDQQVKAFLLENQQAENIKELTALYATLREKKKEAFEDSTPMKRMLRDWEDTKGKLETSYASWVDSFVGMFVDGVAEGKFAFKDFAKSILKDLLTILLRAMIVRAVLGAIGGNVTPTVNSGMNTSSLGGSADFAFPVQTYARGGIATKPQIAIYGEGSMNEAYVPLPDGRSIPVSMSGGGGGGQPPDVTVNVINESGVPVDAEQGGGLDFDGEGYVLDVVLKAAGRPGGFRDGLKAATG